MSILAAFKIETDADLLTITALGSQNKEASDEAFRLFYKEYGATLRQFIYDYCVKHYDRGQITDDVFSATIGKIYRYCGGFSDQGIKDPRIVKKMIHGWIGQIAVNEYKNLLKRRKKMKEQQILVSTMMMAAKKNRGGEERASAFKVVLNDALRELSQRDRELFLTCYELKVKGSKLTTEDTEGICERFGVTEINRRKIVSRSFKTIKEYIEAQGFEIISEENDQE